jgi:hypothetical protein
MPIFSRSKLIELGANKATTSACHKQIFPGDGTVFDRETRWLRGRGQGSKGTRVDQWRAYLGASAGQPLGQVLRNATTLDVAAGIVAAVPGGEVGALTAGETTFTAG